MIGLATLSYSMEQIMRIYGGFFSIQILSEVMSNVSLAARRESQSFANSATTVEVDVHCAFQRALTRKSRPCRGTYGRANQTDRCMNLLHCAQRSTPLNGRYMWV